MLARWLDQFDQFDGSIGWTRIEIGWTCHPWKRDWTRLSTSDDALSSRLDSTFAVTLFQWNRLVDQEQNQQKRQNEWSHFACFQTSCRLLSHKWKSQWELQWKSGGFKTFHQLQQESQNRRTFLFKWPKNNDRPGNKWSRVLEKSNNGWHMEMAMVLRKRIMVAPGLRSPMCGMLRGR